VDSESQFFGLAKKGRHLRKNVWPQRAPKPCLSVSPSEMLQNAMVIMSNGQDLSLFMTLRKIFWLAGHVNNFIRAEARG